MGQAFFGPPLTSLLWNVVLFLNSDGTVKSSQTIAFGDPLTSLGDLDGDGVTDLAYGAPGEDTGRGAVYVFFFSAVNENDPVFTSPDMVNVAKNTTAVLTVTATDADLPAQTVSFSIVGGADQSKFGLRAASTPRLSRVTNRCASTSGARSNTAMCRSTS